MLLLVVFRPFLSPWLRCSVIAGWMQCSPTATPEVTGCNLFRELVHLHGDRRWRQQIHMTASLKQPPCWLRGTRSACRCQTLAALPVHRLIIGHPSPLLWSPLELWALRARHLFHIRLVLVCFQGVVSHLLPVQWSKIYFRHCSQWFTAPFKDAAARCATLQPFSVWFHYLDIYSKQLRKRRI